ncbi:MAG: SAM-dependent methyltransferase [Ruegeria sp.]|uniref:SAM-dependent methyltransferase n=1 Tax=Ruegeria sp. TaxID=1879320 RepID=UPI00349EECF8
MRGVKSACPDKILARGAERGVAVEPFGPIWDSARLKFGRAAWSQSGLEPFLTYDVPYTGTSSGRLSEDAVDIFLSTASSAGPLRILELGAGSGVFAKLFLDRLLDLDPAVYARTTYVVSDGSETVLSAMSQHRILNAHLDRIETRVLDVVTDPLGEAEFDAILGTYILDSLPFDLLAVNDQQTWRKEVRSVVEGDDVHHADQLRADLIAGSSEKLREWAWIAPRLGLQTRHVPIDRAQLDFGDSLPRDTRNQTIPFVHCQGALACLDACRRALRQNGVAVFSDYGHLTFLPKYEFLEFQVFGSSIAVGVNFEQMSAAAEGWPDAVLYRPSEEEGNLHTRVLQRAHEPDSVLQGLVDGLYGAATYHTQNDPLTRARAMLESRYFESARAHYREALSVQPRNWAIMEEVASAFMMMTEDYGAAVEMADMGLALNPVAPGLWRVKGEALLALARANDARGALEQLADLAPTLPSTWRVIAELELVESRYAEALDAVATGFKSDKACEEQEELLSIQGRVLAALASQEHKVLTARANQMRALDNLPESSTE